MDIKKAIDKIKKNWSKYSHETKDGHEAVWVACSDKSATYEIDEEWIGVKGDGSLVWAYASGCSCWDGDYDTDVQKEVKAFKLSHDIPLEKWEQAIVSFAQDGISVYL